MNLIELVLQHKEDLFRYDSFPVLDHLLEERLIRPLNFTVDSIKEFTAVINQELIKVVVEDTSRYGDYFKRINPNYPKQSRTELTQYLAFAAVFYSALLVEIPQDRNRNFFVDYVRLHLAQFSLAGMNHELFFEENKISKNFDLQKQYLKRLIEYQERIKSIIKTIPERDIMLFIESVYEMAYKFEALIDQATPFYKEREDAHLKAQLDKVPLKSLSEIELQRWELERDVHHRFAKAVGNWLGVGKHCTTGEGPYKIDEFGLFHYLPEKYRQLIQEL